MKTLTVLQTALAKAGVSRVGVVAEATVDVLAARLTIELPGLDAAEVRAIARRQAEDLRKEGWFIGATPPEPNDKLLRRIMQRTDMSDDCWLWTGAPDKDGYGRVQVDRRTCRVHRVVYEMFFGAIPDGLVIDHLCRVRNCVNPNHLEPVTDRENLLRGETFNAANAAKETCIHGHPFDEANTHICPRGFRRCRACRRKATARWRHGEAV